MAAVKVSGARGDPPLLRAVEVARLIAWVLEPVMTTTAAGAESSSSSSSVVAARAVLPVGFRFRPTDEELVRHYLMAMIAGRPYSVLLAIPDMDLVAVEPWDLPTRSVIKSDDAECFFAVRRDRPKYPGKSSRSCCSIAARYWKPTGMDPLIRAPGLGGCRGKGVLISIKKTLIFHRGRTPRGARTPWIMHEYTATTDPQSQSQSQSAAWPQNDFQDRGGRGHGTLQFFCVDTFVTDALLCYISTGIYENACRLKGGAASALPLVHLFVNSILLLLFLFEARCYPHSQGALLSRMSGGIASVVVLKATDVTTALYDIDHKLFGAQAPRVH